MGRCAAASDVMADAARRALRARAACAFSARCQSLAAAAAQAHLVAAVCRVPWWGSGRGPREPRVPSNDAGPGVDPRAEAHPGDARKRAWMRRAARRVPAAAMGRAVTAVGGPLWSAAMAPGHAQRGAASPLNLPSPPMRRRLAWEQPPQVAAHGQDQGAVPSSVREYAPLDLKPLPEPSAHAGPGPAQAADARAAARRVTPAFLPLRPVLAVPDPKSVSGHGAAAPAWMWGSGMRQPAANLHVGWSLQEAAPHEADSSQAR